MTRTGDDLVDIEAEARAAQELLSGKPKAPESPRIRTWNRRIMQLGCLPLIIAGFLAAMRVPYVVEVGTLLALAVGLPIAAYAIVLRRRNQAAYEAAVVQANQKDMRVRTIETPAGDHEYVLVEREPIEVFEPIAGSEPGEGGETLASRGADPSSIGSQSGTPEVGRVESDAGGGS